MKIRIGDKANIYLNDGSSILGAIIQHVPLTSGDMWHFELNDTLFIQNPTSSNLDVIVVSIRKEE